MFERLRAECFYAKRSKCAFGKRSVKYLGHVVENGSVCVDPGKAEGVCSWPRPTCTKDVQQFLGLANYYNKFIRGFAEIASPLSDLLSPKAEWI